MTETDCNTSCKQQGGVHPETSGWKFFLIRCLVRCGHIQLSNNYPKVLTWRCLDSLAARLLAAPCSNEHNYTPCLVALSWF